MKILVAGLLKRERQDFILKEINLHNKALSSSLSLQLNVSEDTIRRDLAELSDLGKIIKVHGGALSRSYHYPLQQNSVYAQDKKIIIAKKAVELIQSGMTILTEAGTTMQEMVRLIPDNIEATFFTVSPLMALELARHPLLTVILLGGKTDMVSQINVGERPISELAEIRVDLCFLGVNAIDAKCGLTETDWNVSQVKKAMIKSSDKLSVITISEKLNSVLKMKVCSPKDIDYLITELKPNNKHMAGFKTTMTIM